MDTRYLRELSQKGPDARRSALEGVLSKEGINFTLQKEDPSEKYPRGIYNYLFTSETPGGAESAGSTPLLLFCAHYDAVPGSFGANDNAAAVCILLELYKAMREAGVPADFIFFDGEESGHSGSKLYLDLVNEKKQRRPDGAVNLDVCGYGDDIVVYGKGSEKKDVFAAFVNRDVLKTHGAQIVGYLPESDDIVLRKGRIPSLSLAVVPRWDVQYLKAMAASGEGLLGRTPEFRMMESDMEVTSTMHGGYRDTPDWVQPEAMEKMLQYLRDVCLHPAPAKKHFSFLHH
ncbi:MAG: M28 family metallopeptidase [Lachnospiraceae bacterium]|jgi:hypothetical protein|nr:M28 family metallopeptidase [Lachnospiraceae bacterium]MCH4030119.1 M28 family metallopeptidase [Lachnospiraceae bacterium]MCH4070227.1 M28 family metallopeptidase [Lachnospiraceae bacterium]MCH4107733.1 M28 family metallopeptidase [Lachnospiraceae bacterium]MCI1301416.1 M28 family metallopeptidase [Lachnospiraceae bacterium]